MIYLAIVLGLAAFLCPLGALVMFVKCNRATRREMDELLAGWRKELDKEKP